MAKDTPTEAMATMATTISNSNNVNPFTAVKRLLRASKFSVLLHQGQLIPVRVTMSLPAANVRILPVTTRLPVGAE
jgi:hypothetical protein